MSNLIERLRKNARRRAQTGGYLPSEHIDWMAAQRIAELERALRYIAEYAHPDFPADDLAGELDRAEKIWLQFQNVASFALKGQDDE